MSFTDGLLVGTTGKSGGGNGLGGNSGKGDESACSKKKAKDDKLSKSTQSLIANINDDPSSASSYCRKKAQEMSKRVATFDHYRDALPSARAANELNALGDKNSSESSSDCLTMITDAETLNAELGLPPGTITEDQLRNDDIGFRAAMFKDEATGKHILVARDTQPNSLVDWRTNIDNGKGLDTPQYAAMRDLTETLVGEGVPFDLAGYSKGGGLAQEAGLINIDSEVRVFNSAGIHDASLARTGTNSFDGLTERTNSFSSEGEFLTHMNNTTDPQSQIENAIFLRLQLSGDGPKVLKLLSPMEITYRNPAMLEAYEYYKTREGRREMLNWISPKLGSYYDVPDNPDPNFESDKAALLNDMDKMINGYRQQLADGTTFTMFPPVRTGRHETVEDSRSMLASALGSGDFDADNLNTTKLIQHQMGAVLNPMEESVKDNRLDLSKFNSRCG